MRRPLTLLALLSLLAFTCPAQTTDSAAVIGSLTRCWRSFSHEYSSIYGLEEDDIKRYAKQRVCFTPDSISMYLSVLHSPTYAIRKVNAEDYAKDNFDCGKQKLGISMDSVYEVTISSIAYSPRNGEQHKMTDIVVFDGYSLFIMVDGVIFKLLDADAKVQPRSGN